MKRVYGLLMVAIGFAGGARASQKAFEHVLIGKVDGINSQIAQKLADRSAAAAINDDRQVGKIDDDINGLQKVLIKAKKELGKYRASERVSEYAGQGQGAQELMKYATLRALATGQDIQVQAVKDQLKKDKGWFSWLRSKSSLPVNEQNAQLRTVLHDVVLANKDNAAEVVKTLLDDGANPNLADRDGNTPLHFAAELGNKGVVEALIKGGADIFEQNSSAQLPIELAAKKGNEVIVGLFIEKDPELLNRKNRDDETLFYEAASIGSEQLVRLLIDKGADIYMPNANGETPFASAVYWGHRAIVRLLLSEFEKRYKNTGSSQAALAPNNPDLFGNAPLHKALLGGHGEVLSLLLKSSMVDKLAFDINGMNIAHIVVMINNPSLADIIVKNLTAPIMQKLVNSLNKYGETPPDLIEKYKRDGLRAYIKAQP